MPRVVVFDETGAPDVLHIVDEPAAEPGPGEVRVRIEAAGVNRLDQIMRSGGYPRPFSLPRRPSPMPQPSPCSARPR